MKSTVGDSFGVWSEFEVKCEVVPDDQVPGNVPYEVLIIFLFSFFIIEIYLIRIICIIIDY